MKVLDFQRNFAGIFCNKRIYIMRIKVLKMFKEVFVSSIVLKMFKETFVSSIEYSTAVSILPRKDSLRQKQKMKSKRIDDCAFCSCFCLFHDGMHMRESGAHRAHWQTHTPTHSRQWLVVGWLTFGAQLVQAFARLQKNWLGKMHVKFLTLDFSSVVQFVA